MSPQIQEPSKIIEYQIAWFNRQGMPCSLIKPFKFETDAMLYKKKMDDSWPYRKHYIVKVVRGDYDWIRRFALEHRDESTRQLEQYRKGIEGQRQGGGAEGSVDVPGVGDLRGRSDDSGRRGTDPRAGSDKDTGVLRSGKTSTHSKGTRSNVGSPTRSKQRRNAGGGKQGNG